MVALLVLLAEACGKALAATVAAIETFFKRGL
jgi:hypothetical protein